jgi:hypothetical protein
METVFNSISLALFVVAILTFVGIVREVFQHLNEEDQDLFRRALRNTWTPISPAIKNAWKEHTRLFPKSRKRLFFAIFLIVASLFSYGAPNTAGVKSVVAIPD